MASYTAWGKLFIAGEYAVVTPGQPAIVTAVDRALVAHVEPSQSEGISIHSPVLEGGRVEWQAHEVPGRGEAVEHALDVMNEYLEGALEAESYRVDIASTLHAENGIKYGFGSSGAVIVAVIGALAQARDMSLHPRTHFALSALAALRVDERASCADIAASIWGGTLAYRAFDRSHIAKRARSIGVRECIDKTWEGLSIRPLAVHPDLTPTVGHSGHSASTSALVAAFDSATAAHPAAHAEFLESSRVATEHLERALVSGEGVGDALRGAREAYDSLASSPLSLPLHTPELARMIETAEAMGIACKISGAGGGDCVIALAPTPTAREDLARAWRSYNATEIRITVPPSRHEEAL